MQFRKISSMEPVVDDVTRAIQSRLDDGQKVLWFVPGGSAIAVAVEVSRRLSGDLTNLAMTLTDERYGQVGHADSNWQQLMEAGFALSGADLRPVLQDDDDAETTISFGRDIEELSAWADYSLGLFGMGADGHIAGILPGERPMASKGLTFCYESGTYWRITMTLPAIARLDEAVVYAVGESKQQALTDLQRELSVEVQPAQVLKQVAKVTMYNDYVGESLL